MELPVPVTEVGLKASVTPVGAPLTEKATGELYPPLTVLVILTVPLEPWRTVSALEAEAMVKVGTGVVAPPVSAASRPLFGLPQPVTRS